MDLRSHPRLPSAKLTSGGREQDAEQSSFCWSRPSSTGGSGSGEEVGGTGLCADAAGVSVPKHSMLVGRGAEIELTGDANKVDASIARLARNGRLHYIQKLNLSDGSDRIDVPPGTYVLDVFATFDPGDSGFDFSIRVR